jgi:hypothetical protein
MPGLDLFNNADYDSFAATRQGWGPGLDTSFGENFGQAFNESNRVGRDLRMQRDSIQHVQDWIDKFQAATGYAPPNPELAPDPILGAPSIKTAFYERLAKAYANELKNRPDLGLPAPPSADEARMAAVEVERKRLAEAGAPRPTDLFGAAGGALGGMAGVAADPINLGSMIVAVPPGAGILSTALRLGAIGAGAQAAIEVAGASVNREINPDYGVGQAALNIGGAAVGGAAFGAGIKGLARIWSRIRRARPPVATERPAGTEEPAAPEAAPAPPEPGQTAFPRTVIDAGNVVERQALVSEGNPYRSAGLDGEMAHARNYQEAEKAIVEGRAPEIPQDQFATGAWRPGKVFTSGGHEVGVRYEVVEADSLVASQRADLSPNPDYPAALQPRDRTRAASAEQVNEIAARLNPERLGPSPEAATGAPVVGPDNVIESGNGRWLALKRAYANDAPDAPMSAWQVANRQSAVEFADKLGVTQEIGRLAAEGRTAREIAATLAGRLTEDEVRAVRDNLGIAGGEAGGMIGVMPKRSSASVYRDYLRAQGFDTTGLREPVLIARRTTPMTEAERVDFAAAANRSVTARMSAPEQAAADARLLDGPVIAKLAEGGIDNVDNRPFVKGFFKNLPPEERAPLIDRHGVLSTEGIRRVEAAMLARAYGDPALLSRILEDPDNNIKALAGALTDTAGAWAGMRDAVSRGTVPAGMDITPDLLDAMRLVAKARDERVKLLTLVDQPEMFAAPSPWTRAFLHPLMFRDEGLTKAASRASVARGLKAYADEAIKNTTAERLFGKPVSVGEVLTAALAKARREDLGVAAEEATLPLRARETLAKPEVDDAVLHQLDNLRDEAQDAGKELMVPDPNGLQDAAGNPVMRPVRELLDEADAEIAAAKNIEACAGGADLSAAAE